MYVRNCSICGIEIKYKTKKYLNRAIKSNTKCARCAQKNIQSGSKNGMFGKKHTESTKQKIKEKRKFQKFSNETRKKMSIAQRRRLKEYNHWSGRNHKDMSKDKMRKISANRIRNNKWHPSYNVKACEIIEKYGKKNGYCFQHALNGGEMFIESVGYWVDGYDKEKNVVIEFYENAHKYTDIKDTIRIGKIKQALNCEIIILKEWEIDSDKLLNS